MTTYIEPGPSSPSSANSALISPSDQPSSPARTKRERQLSRNHRPPIGNDGSSYSPSPSSPQMAPSSSHDTLQHQRTKPRSILTLPLFIPKETSSPSPSSPNGPRIGRRPSLQDSPSLSPPKRERFLPSHHASPSPPRGRLFTSPGNAGRENSPRREGGSPHPRRWSTAISGNKTSGGLAHRLAEGASPYLRAGLDELRSIFDVDSDPIPISALDEDDSNADEEMSRDRGGEISVNLTSPTSEYPSPSVEVSRTSSLDGGFGMGLGLYRASSLSSRSSKSTSQPKPTEAIEKAAQRAEDGTMDVAFSAAGLGINRGILAWSLALIAIGMTALCAYGYAMHSDTFSPTLIGFFLTQPAFALMGLIALLLRRRALMDLFSRAMRAHVLAQACIVLLAYLDLSASSFYVSSTSSLRSRPFRMVPTMEMKFGPYRGPIEAGDTPGINLLYSKASRASADGLSSGSDHSHDPHVGDFQSRLTHLIVFLVQAALPIVAALIGQYLVAQRLAWLARRTSASSRQSSSSSKTKSERNSPELARRSTLPKNTYRHHSKTLPSSSSLSSERLSSRLAAEIPPLPVNSRAFPKSLGQHTRSLSQPLDLLSKDISTEESDQPKSFLSLPLSESPPVED